MKKVFEDFVTVEIKFILLNSRIEWLKGPDSTGTDKPPKVL